MINRKIENLAEKVLKKIDVISVEQIDLPLICKNYGISLEVKNLENNISGLYVVKNDSSYIICNKGDSEKRRRFTIAHELGHHFLHKEISPLFVEKSGMEGMQIFHRDEQSSTGEKYREREANAFAAALLMPKDFIIKEISILEKRNFEGLVHELAEKFTVSEQAMSFRLANLGYGF